MMNFHSPSLDPEKRRRRRWCEISLKKKTRSLLYTCEEIKINSENINRKIYRNNFHISFIIFFLALRHDDVVQSVGREREREKTRAKSVLVRALHLELELELQQKSPENRDAIMTSRVQRFPLLSHRSTLQHKPSFFMNQKKKCLWIVKEKEPRESSECKYLQWLRGYQTSERAARERAKEGKLASVRELRNFIHDSVVFSPKINVGSCCYINPLTKPHQHQQTFPLPHHFALSGREFSTICERTLWLRNFDEKLQFDYLQAASG